MTRTSRAPLLAGLALAGLALSACGEQEPDSAADPSQQPSSSSESPSDSPSETPTEDAGPACADVWVAGATLPENYSGCQDATKDKWVQAMVYRCSSGQRLVTFGTTFYAAKGEVVNESDVPLRRNKDFQKILASCGA